jgi:apolipoprotein N-acyltransferase
MGNEIELLKQQLTQARRDGTLAAMGFLYGAIGFGYLIQWYARLQHWNVESALPLLGIGCALSGALWSAVFISLSRARAYLARRRSEKGRLQEYLFNNQLDQHRKQ